MEIKNFKTDACFEDADPDKSSVIEGDCLAFGF